MLESAEAPAAPESARATAPADSPRPRPRRWYRRLRPPLALLPWLFPAVGWVVALLHTGTPGHDIALYAAYFALDVVLPGTLVHRALRGSRGNLPEDLGLGAATGMLLLLAGWGLAALTDKHVLLPWWPALIVVPFLTVPRLHRYWRVSDPRPLPIRWSWIVAAGLSLLVAGEYPTWASAPLPPAGGVLYQDLYYHLALIHEMTRPLPFQVPQMIGGTLHYHFLSDADIAVGSLITQIDPAVILLRLWMVPVAGTALLVFAALARELSGKWWAGALGGTAAIVSMPLLLGTATTALAASPISPLSPSQTYVLPLLGLLVLLAVEVLRGRALRWGWLLVFPLALACAGAKSSALPPLLAGLLAATVVVAIRNWRRLPATLAYVGLVVGAVVLGFRLFAGGGAGTLGLQPLAILYWVVPYRETIGHADDIDGTRFLPLGVEYANTAAKWYLAGILCWWLLMQAPRTMGLLAIGTGRTKREPTTWLLAGMVAAGAGATFLLWHPSASQIYFFMDAAPFGAVLTACLLADQARSWRPALAGAVAGGTWALLAPQMPPPRVNSILSWSWTLAEPVIRTAVVATGVAIIALLLRQLKTGRFAWRAVGAGLVAAVLVAGLVGGAERQVREVQVTLEKGPPPPDDPLGEILPQEMAAAYWLAENSGRDDVVATNVHCQRINSTTDCDARAFWVAGLSGRRTVIESWGYTDQAVATDGVNGERYMRQPAPDLARFELNDRVFTEARPADVAELRRLYDVKWLFADERTAGGITPDLAKVATLRHAQGPVRIYELP